MYEKIIEGYINSLTKDDIKNFASQKNISLSDKDLNTIYEYAKTYWKEFYKGDPTSLLKELEEKLEPTTFLKLKQLYIETKNKFLS